MGARLALMLAIGGQLAGCNVDVWLTPDQQGRLLFRAGEYERAAESFSDPAWRAAALHRAGRYQQAAEELALLEGEQPAYNRGVALALAEQWEPAAEAFERALELRPDWPEASDSLEYVKLHIPWRPENGGGEMGTTGRDAEPDDVAYDADKERLEKEGIDTRMEGAVLSDEQIAEMWLRQIDPSPRGFLQRKFTYQLAVEQQ